MSITDESPARCEGCGERPEVHGSSWCASCHGSLPEYTKRRILTLRNALIMVGFRGDWSIDSLRDAARKALEKPLPWRAPASQTKRDAT